MSKENVEYFIGETKVEKKEVIRSLIDKFRVENPSIKIGLEKGELHPKLLVQMFVEQWDAFEKENMEKTV